MVFIEIQNLQELEKERKWKQVVSLLQNKWYQDKNNIDIMLRLASECWYIMSNWNFLDLDNSKLNFDDVQSILIETYDYFIKNCITNNKALAIFGYMVALFPNYFYTDYDKNGKIFLQYENKGKDMLKSAYANEPENKLYKALYLGTNNDLDKAVLDAKKDLNNIIQQLFPQDTKIEEYFKEVLTKWQKINTQKELINLFGNNYNSLDNLVKYLNGKYHPKYFKNFKEFCTSLNIRNQSVDEYKSDYISENDGYFI